MREDLCESSFFVVNALCETCDLETQRETSCTRPAMYRRRTAVRSDARKGFPANKTEKPRQDKDLSAPDLNGSPLEVATRGPSRDLANERPGCRTWQPLCCCRLKFRETDARNIAPRTRPQQTSRVSKLLNERGRERRERYS